MNGSRWWKMLAVSVFMAAPVLADGNPAEEQKEAKEALAKAKVSMVDAIKAAMAKAEGAKPYKAELEIEEGKLQYDVELLAGGKSSEVEVDAITGKVLKVEGQEEEEKEKEKEGAKEEDESEAKERAEAAKALAEAKLSMTEAIETAIKETKGGKPFAAELEIEEGKARYGIDLMAGEHYMDIDVDAVTGKVIEVEEKPLVLGVFNFDKDPAGKAPEGWSIRETHHSKELAKWKVVADPAAPSKPNVLCLESENTGGTFNLAIAEKSSFKDVDVSVKIRSNTGKEDQGGGLIWRCKDENNYYVCRMNPLEPNFRVYKVVDGRRQQLQSVKVETQTGKWHSVRAIMIGDHITCSLDGKKMLDVRDDTFKDAGMVGFWTKADASSCFDNLVVRKPIANEKEEAAKPKVGEKAGEGKAQAQEKDEDNDEDEAKEKGE